MHQLPSLLITANRHTRADKVTAVAHWAITVDDTAESSEQRWGLLPWVTTHVRGLSYYLFQPGLASSSFHPLPSRHSFFFLVVQLQLLEFHNHGQRYIRPRLYVSLTSHLSHPTQISFLIRLIYHLTANSIQLHQPEDGPVTAVYSPGDIAWILASTALVWIMIPGVGYFYSGLLRRKNALSMIYLSMMCLAVVSFQVSPTHWVCNTPGFFNPCL